jgi:hypothetical protein
MVMVKRGCENCLAGEGDDDSGKQGTDEWVSAVFHWDSGFEDDL